MHGVTDFIWASKVHKKYKDNKNYFLSKFEDLINNPYDQINRICNFLNISFTEKMLHPPMIDSSYDNKYNRKISDGFDKKTLERWKNSITPSEKLFIDIITKHAGKRFNY